jgi:uncharacterized protein (TIGR02246 family)
MRIQIGWVKRTQVLMLVAGLVIGFQSVVARAQDSRTADESAIRQNVAYLESGWNTKSGELFAKPFGDEADYVVINGSHIKGRGVIAAGHQRIFDTIFKDTRISLKVKQIRFIRSDVAVVHVDGKRVGLNEADSQDAIMTMIMTKEKTGWIVTAFQNTAVGQQ